MDVVRKNNRDSVSPEPKKEHRLKTIIDQLKKKNINQFEMRKNGSGGNKNREVEDHHLLSLENKDEPATVKPEYSGQRTSPVGRDGLVTASLPEGGGARGQQPGTRAFVPTSRDMPTNAVASSSDPTGAAVKSERVSPESSPSTSPHSPSPARVFSGAGFLPFAPIPAFQDFSLANLIHIPKHEDMMTTRNYSDYMRSLAAKYNQELSFTSTQLNGSRNAQESLPSSESNSTTPFAPRNTTSGQSSGQIKNSLRAMVKRNKDGTAKLDPLDLTNPKRFRTDGPIPSHTSVSDLYELIHGQLNSENEPANNICDNDLLQRTYKSNSNQRIHKSNSVGTRNSPPGDKELNFGATDECLSQSNAVSQWTVEDVMEFVASVDSCNEYAEIFKEQRIDGCVLPLLSEQHLTSNLNMKLGPALKLRLALAKKIGQCIICMHCIHCHTDEPSKKSERTQSPSPPSGK